MASAEVSLHDVLRTPIGAVAASLWKASRDDSDDEYELIYVSPSTSVRQAEKLLTQCKLSALPIIVERESGEKTAVGFVDNLDIAKYVVDKMGPRKFDEKAFEQHDGWGMRIMGQDISDSTVDQVKNLSGSSPNVVVTPDTSFHVVLEMFSKGLKRVAIVKEEKSDDSDSIRVFTQSDAITYLLQCVDSCPTLSKLAEMTLKDLGFALTPFVSIHDDTPVIKVLGAFFQEGTDAVALINGSGQLTGNFSPADVKGLYRQLMPYLDQPVHRYLKQYSPKSLSVASKSPSESVKSVLEAFKRFKLHHLWVVDTENKPLGVISIQDAISLIARWGRSPSVFPLPCRFEVRVRRVSNLKHGSGSVSCRLELPSEATSRSPSVPAADSVFFDVAVLVRLDPGHWIDSNIIIWVDEDGKPIGSAAIAVKWLLSAYGTRNPALTYCQESFDLKDSKGGAVGRVHCEFTANTTD